MPADARALPRAAIALRSGRMPRSAQKALARSILATDASRPGMSRILAAAESMAARLRKPPRVTTDTASERRTSSPRSRTSMAPSTTCRTLRAVSAVGACLVGLLSQPVA